MYKFIAMVWNVEDASAIQAAEFLRNKIQSGTTIWETAYGNLGLSVLHTGKEKGQMQAIKLGNNGGVVLGKLFKTSASSDHISVENTLSESESQKILKTSGKHLVEHYWGRYVAFLKNEGASKTSVLKGPIEGWRCYYADYDEVTVYFSCFEDILQLDLFNLSINWHYIALYTKFFMLDNVNTAFNELFKLQPGECRHYIQGRVTNTFYWNPVKIASQANIIEDPNEAARLLRKTVVGCIAAWANSYGKIMHKLSGGLDSSIVLACLMESRNAENISCLNYFPSSDKSGDERYFARLVSQYHGVELVERELDPSKVKLERLFDISPLATPEWYLNAMDRCSYEAQLARDTGASVLFAGEGGDALFYQPRTYFVTSDYLHKHGLTPTLFWVALNNARLMKKSVWSVLYDAVKDRMVNSRGNDFMIGSVQESPLLNSEIMQDIEYKDTLNPVLAAANNLPNGKRLHILITDFPNKYHYSAKTSDFLEVCYPLLSQPVIELCLKIPSYILTTGGKDRGLARMAFKNDIPKEILRRESKGGIQNYAQEILNENIDFIREIMLDGILVKENFLNRDALEQALSGTRASVNFETVNVLRHVCTEIWLRKMMEFKIKIAA